MATWTVEISVADLSAKLVNVAATRTGDDVRVFHLNGVSVDTHDKPLAQIRAEVGEALWRKYQDGIAKETKIAAMLSGWEAPLASDLNEMEA